MSMISYLTTIRFEFGAIQGIQQDLTDLGIRKPLIIADEGVAKAGLVGKITGIIDSGADFACLFTGTPTNPTEEAVEAALSMYGKQGCDGLIAVGGGSPIDLAKGVALLATHDGPLEQYAAILGGIPKITAAVAPIIAVPTTAGTGSEVGRASLITLKDGRKLGFIPPHLIPKRAVCDPELTLGLPPWLTAATGMDAVTHCVETYLSPRDNPPAEAIALDGLKRAVDNIEKAVADGSDRDARYQMMMAALEGGLTFQKGLGAVHALSHPLGGLKDLSLPRHPQRGDPAGDPPVQPEPCRSEIRGYPLHPRAAGRCRSGRLFRPLEQPAWAAEDSRGNGRSIQHRAGHRPRGHRGPFPCDERQTRHGRGLRTHAD